MCAYRHVSLCVCVSLHTLPSWLPLSCLHGSKSWMPHCRKSWTMQRCWPWKLMLVLEPPPDWWESRLGLFRFLVPLPQHQPWVSSHSLDEPQLLGPDMTVLCGMSGCVGMCMFHWQTWSLLETTGPESHELTVVSIGFTFTENRAETARVTWAFVALWCHRWHFDLQYVVVSFYYIL